MKKIPVGATGPSGRINAGFPIALWYFWMPMRSVDHALIFAGFSRETTATEGDTQWVNYKPRPFSARSTDF